MGPLVVYTMSIGWPYPLPPVVEASGVDFVCFTDQSLPDANGWEIREAQQLLPSDPFRSSRNYKVRPHLFLSDYEKSIFIDTTVHLQNNPLEFWEKLIPHHETVFGGFYHASRYSVTGEFRGVRTGFLDLPEVLDEQEEAYKQFAPEALSARPVWGGCLARRHMDPICMKAMETWFANILRYSRRDQLSLPLALSEIPNSRISIAPGEEMRRSEFHAWRRDRKHRPPYRTVQKEGEMSEDSPEKLVPQSTRFSTFGFDADSGLFFAQDKNLDKVVYVSHEQRLRLYRKGFEHRQRWILKDYTIPCDLLNEGDVVVDVGANVGEIGLWANALGAQYVAFEPDPVAFKAMQKNVKGDLFDIALSDSSGTCDLFLQTSTADSSLFQPSEFSSKVTVTKARLDDVLTEAELTGPVKLMKIEAEGLEPEVLRGAAQVLSRTEFVAVDAGPERGGENTVPEVLNFLFSHGFEIVSCFIRRGTFFLRRVRSS